MKTFDSCTSLQSISIPSSVKALYERCFSHTGLSNVTFEAGSQLSTLGSCVFFGCLPPLPIFIPSEIKEIGGGIPVHLKNSFESVNDKFILRGDFFLNLRSKSIIQYFGRQQEIDLVAVLGELGTDLRVVGELGPALFACDSVLKSICIPSSVEILCEDCFRSCNHLSSVIFEMGRKLSAIKHGAFAKCLSLTSICIPAAVKTLGTSCFEYCIKLLSVTFESRSQNISIGDRSFRGCESLASICIPATVQSLGITCFENCKSTVRLIQLSQTRNNGLIH
jgi:hypothetical protein